MEEGTQGSPREGHRRVAGWQRRSPSWASSLDGGSPRERVERMRVETSKFKLELVRQKKRSKSGLGDEKKTAPARQTLAAGVGFARVGIFPPAPGPTATRTRGPYGLSNP